MRASNTLLTPLDYGKLNELNLDTILGQNIESIPGYLRISLVEACNERCYFCHNEGSAGRTKTIDEKVMWNSIAASLSLGKNKFKFTGGEPTLHPKLVEYVQMLKHISPDSEVGIITNATRLRELGRPLYEAGLDSINVSLHTLDPERYQEVTGTRLLHKALDGLNEMDKLGFTDITINMVVGKGNYQDVRAIKQFADLHGYKLRLLDILPSNQESDKQIVLRDELESSFPDITVKPKIYHPKCEGCSFKSSCGEGVYLRLSAQGELLPCMYREDLKIQLYGSEYPETIKKKVALGFRRLTRDDL